MLEKSERPWGRYEVLQEGATYKVKSIHVNPGKRLSYQRHQKRSEHWYVTDGSGEVTLDGKYKWYHGVQFLKFRKECCTELVIPEIVN